MTESANLLVGHQLLEHQMPEPLNDGCGSKPSEDRIRNGNSWVPRHHKGKAVIHGNFEPASTHLLHDEVPIDGFLFYEERDVSRKGSGQIPSVDDVVRRQINEEITRSQAFDLDIL